MAKVFVILAVAFFASLLVVTAVEQVNRPTALTIKESRSQRRARGL